MSVGFFRKGRPLIPSNDPRGARAPGGNKSRGYSLMKTGGERFGPYPHRDGLSSLATLRYLDEVQQPPRAGTAAPERVEAVRIAVRTRIRHPAQLFTRQPLPP